MITSIREFINKVYADIIAYIDADLYYIIKETRKNKHLKYRFISVKRLKKYNKFEKGKTNKNRIKISQLEQAHFYKTKDWSK